MGSLGLIFVIYVLAILLLFCIKPCRDKNKHVSKLSIRLTHTLFYNSYISIMTESYSLIAVCCCISFSIISFDSYGVAIQSFTSLTFFTMLIAFPIITVRHLSKNFSQLEKVGFKAKYGEFYEGLKLSNGPVVFWQPIWFLIRRFLLATTIVWRHRVLVLQVVQMTGQIITAVIIIGNVRPFTDPKKSRFEFFNEIMIMLVMYHIICFSPFVPSLETKFLLGYSVCFVVSMHLVINLYFIMK